MLAYAIRRFLQFIPTIVAISLIMFFLLNVLPGDAALMSGGMRQQTDAKVMEHMSARTTNFIPVLVMIFLL